MTTYRIDIKDNVLTFSTASFRADKGSVLHSGIFSRELASSLAAGSVLMLLGFFFGVRAKITPVRLVLGAAVFALLFLAFRGLVFREPALEAVFDRERGAIDISVGKAIGRGRLTYAMSELAGIRLADVVREPENPDGTKVVEKIALQHGMVIPGFGKKEEFATVVLDLSGKPLTIFSTKKREEAERVFAELKNFTR